MQLNRSRVFQPPEVALTLRPGRRINYSLVVLEVSSVFQHFYKSLLIPGFGAVADRCVECPSFPSRAIPGYRMVLSHAKVHVLHPKHVAARVDRLAVDAINNLEAFRPRILEEYIPLICI